jgi:hypothetical protein
MKPAVGRPTLPPETLRITSVEALVAAKTLTRKPPVTARVEEV